MDDYQNGSNNSQGSNNPQENNNLQGNKPPKTPMRPGLVALCVICGCIMFLGFWYILFSQFFGSLFGAITSTTMPNSGSANVVGDTIDVLYVEGTISSDSATYQHNWTINEIDRLMDSHNNKGILLYVNSPGGGVYESDELYLKLKQYKEVTKRPVYAYMAQTAASGGLYVSMAADKIYANRMTMTGSIGVIMSLTDTTGLQKLIGVKQDKVTTGPNKAMGNPLTDDQRAILQSLVDETYDIFVGIVAENRKLDLDKVYKLADGRVYSPKQAKELGLIDEIGTFEELVTAMKGIKGLENCSLHQEIPPTNLLNEILSNVSTDVNSSKALSNFSDIKSYIEGHNGPKLMYYMGE